MALESLEYQVEPDYCGPLRGGHTDRVTSIATTPADKYSLTIVTSSHDNSIIVWYITGALYSETSSYGVPRQRLTGHSDSVNDVALSADGNFVLSASSDNDLRLWDIHTGTTRHRFVGHTAAVLSAAFSADNRQIMSASRDGTIKLWNTIGECKNTIENAHADRVSCLRFSPLSKTRRNQTVVSGSSDRTVKSWNLKNSSCTCSHTFAGHEGAVNAVAVSPDGSLCVSGGEDGVVLMWDFNDDIGKRLVSRDVGSPVHALCFSQTQYWVCIATEECIQIFDLESKSNVAELRVGGDDEEEDGDGVFCTSLSWNVHGNTLFCGYSNGRVRVWEISVVPNELVGWRNGDLPEDQEAGDGQGAKEDDEDVGDQRD